MITEIKNIVFDIGGVLLEWRPERIVRSFTPDTHLQAVLLEKIFGHPDWLRWDLGEISHEQLIAGFTARVGISMEEGQRFMGEVRASLVEKTETVVLMDELKARGYHLFCLSNMPAEHYVYLTSRHTYWNRFEDIMISAHVGLIKPNPAIFRRMLDEFGIDPARSVFIDDSQANIEAGEDVGIRGVLFTGIEDCRRQLARYLDGRS